LDTPTLDLGSVYHFTSSLPGPVAATSSLRTLTTTPKSCSSNWLASLGYDAQTDQMNDWRRDHMSTLLNAFDFEHPNYSIPILPDTATPAKDSNGNWIGPNSCGATYPTLAPPIPWGQQTVADSLVSEDGFKSVRGYLTEGRYLTFELNGFALTNPVDSTNQFTTTPATAAHDSINQRWIVHQLEQGGTTFNISSAADGRWVSQHTSLAHLLSGAETYTITYFSGQGYTLAKENGDYLTFDTKGNLVIASKPAYFSLFSVTYSS